MLGAVLFVFLVVAIIVIIAMSWSDVFSAKAPTHLNPMQCKSMSRGNVVCRTENGKCVCSVNPGVCAQLSGNGVICNMQGNECVCNGPSSLSPSQCASLSSNNVICTTDSTSGKCVCVVNPDLCGALSGNGVVCTTDPSSGKCNCVVNEDLCSGLSANGVVCSMSGGKCVCVGPTCPTCQTCASCCACSSSQTYLAAGGYYYKNNQNQCTQACDSQAVGWSVINNSSVPIALQMTQVSTSNDCSSTVVKQLSPTINPGTTLNANDNTALINGLYPTLYTGCTIRVLDLTTNTSLGQQYAPSTPGNIIISVKADGTGFTIASPTTPTDPTTAPNIMEYYGYYGSGSANTCSACESVDAVGWSITNNTNGPVYIYGNYGTQCPPTPAAVLLSKNAIPAGKTVVWTDYSYTIQGEKYYLTLFTGTNISFNTTPDQSAPFTSSLFPSTVNAVAGDMISFNITPSQEQSGLSVTMCNTSINPNNCGSATT